MSAPRWREVFRGRRGRLTAGLLLLEALVAIQVLVVATILPDIRRDLGMVQLYGLVFTASSLATLAAIPIAGQALDRFGARATLAPTLLCFISGLIVSATAPAMPVVLIGQFLQGAGGGGLYALSLGTIAKTYPDRLRPQGHGAAGVDVDPAGRGGAAHRCADRQHDRLAVRVRGTDPGPGGGLAADHARARPGAAARAAGGRSSPTAGRCN